MNRSFEYMKPYLDDTIPKLESATHKSYQDLVEKGLVPGKDQILKEGPIPAIQGFMTERAKELLPPAAMKIGVDKDELEKRLKRVVIILNPWVNCFVQSSHGRKTFEIGVNTGLMTFSWHMTKLIATRFSVMGKDGHIVEDTKIPLEKTVAAAKRLLCAYWEGQIMHQHVFSVGDLSYYQVSLAGELIFDLESFAVAHELGHIVMELSRPPEHEVGVEIATVLMTKPWKEGGAAIDQRDRSARTFFNQVRQKWGKEIAADLIGLQLSLALKDNTIESAIQFWATESFFIFMDMLETFYERKYGESLISDDHPPSWMRLAALRLIISRDNSPELMEFGNVIEQMVEEILAKIVM